MHEGGLLALTGVEAGPATPAHIPHRHISCLSITDPGALPRRTDMCSFFVKDIYKGTCSGEMAWLPCYEVQGHKCAWTHRDGLGLKHTTGRAMGLSPPCSTSTRRRSQLSTTTHEGS